MTNYAEVAQTTAYADEYGYDFYLDLDDRLQERIANWTTIMIENYHAQPRRSGTPAFLADLEDAGIRQSLYVAQNLQNYEVADAMRILSASQFGDGVINGEIQQNYRLAPEVVTLVDQVLRKKGLTSWKRSS